MRKSFIVATVLSAMAVMVVGMPKAHAYGTYSTGVDDQGNCAQCHGAFKGDKYVSVGEGTTWSENLHDAHTKNTDVTSSPGGCGSCHFGPGTTDREVNLQSSQDARDGVNALACMGCHGRLEDGAANIGAGLRAHHLQSDLYVPPGGLSCAICHGGDPAEPVGEDILPPWYASITNTSIAMTMDPCSIDGEEDFSSNGTGTDNDGDGVYDMLDSDCAIVEPTPGDFDFDGMADILWRNTSTGYNWLYQMNGAAINPSSQINVVGSAWEIVGNGDYNGDDKADILWRHSSTGQNWMYLMSGSTVQSSQPVNIVSDTMWTVVGNGDYNGDGNSDILWFHTGSGTSWIYLMNGPAVLSSLRFIQVSDLQWQIVSSGDYDGDGDSDILWRHAGSGRVWMHQLDGAVISADVGQVTGSAGFSVTIIADPKWSIVGNGDYDGDGNADVLWRHTDSGRNWVHLMNGPVIASSESINIVAGPDWGIVASGDYDGDGMSDILWRNPVSGRNWMYLMNGSVILSSVSVNIVTGAEWQVIDSN